VEISVVDTGEGIPAHELPRIFERFYQRDKSRARRASGSAGLGLAIARELVEAMGGSLRAESVEGLGSRFTVRLPGVGQGGTEAPRTGGVT
jgi:signal transduction histidine kinase